MHFADIRNMREFGRRSLDNLALCLSLVLALYLVTGFVAFFYQEMPPTSVDRTSMTRSATFVTSSKAAISTRKSSTDTASSSRFPEDEGGEAGAPTKPFLPLHEQRQPSPPSGEPSSGSSLVSVESLTDKISRLPLWPFSLGKNAQQDATQSASVHQERLVFVTLVLGSGDMAKLRNFIGSLHQHRNEESRIVPTVIVYQFDLPPTEIGEISLWSGVELYDGYRYLFPGTARLNFGTSAIKNALTSMSMETMLYLKLTVLDLACRKHGSCIYAQTGLTVSKPADAFKTIAQLLTTQGYFFATGGVGGAAVKEDTSARDAETEPPMLTISNSTLMGFLYESFAYVNYVSEPLGCFRNLECDTNLFLETMVTEDLELMTVQQVLGDPAATSEMYYCYIDLRPDILYDFSFLRHLGDARPQPPKGKHRIALGVPTTSFRLNSAEQSSVLTAFLPSFVQTVTAADLESFEFLLYIAFDEGDRFWDNAKIHRQLQQQVTAALKELDQHVTVQYLRLPSTHGWLTYIWNYMYARSMYDHCDYYYQLNDDLQFQTEGWPSKLVQQLQRHGDFGVVGPNDPIWNCTVLTQAMVSRTHWQIFGWFYPPEIKDWYSDFWITKVYGPKNTYCELDNVVKNLRDKGTRYQLCNRPHWYEAVRRDSEIIQTWSKQNRGNVDSM